jgi:hypothetical protein
MNNIWVLNKDQSAIKKDLTINEQSLQLDCEFYKKENESLKKGIIISAHEVFHCLIP